MKAAMIMGFIWLLVILGWANALAEEAPRLPLIQQGSVEVSTLGPMMGTNILGLGAGILKQEGNWMSMLGLSIGYFAQSFIEFEGSFGFIRSSGEANYGGDYSTLTIIGVGKFVLNYVIPEFPIIPYAFGGGGLVNERVSYDEESLSESESLIVFGAGMKLPMKVIRRLATRIEYSYNRYDREYSPVTHAVSIGFSLFL